ncbi:AMP-binding protein [Rhodococcus pseudokoreensis]|uniref:AMP-binding protein n=1 Tax=Rhodococcus pseudokoreensis TaxID=2811421 RepID=A0A974W2I5_9NOCA|nr:AMP-binding protein [Rhodococcus pseudokoreensis]QSE89866.1 AMP-binding protein [Rhodococcus pseudokoreensis]
MTATHEARSGPRPGVVEILRAVAATVGDREAVVHGRTRRTYAEVVANVDAFARYLVSRGAGCEEACTDTGAFDTNQKRLALYLHNGLEFAEALYGAMAARAAPFNVNYRYTATELVAIFDDAAPAVIVYHSMFAATLIDVLPELPHRPVLVQVPDHSDYPLLPGAVWFGDALTTAPTAQLPEPSGEDLVLVYTGGTTGRPKGVMWRNHDLWIAACGGADYPADITAAQMGRLADEVPGPKFLASAPFMHGAGLWFLMRVLAQGGTVVIPDAVTRFDEAQACALIEHERINCVLLVAEAFANPMARHLTENKYDLDCVTFVGLGGGITTMETKSALMAAMPNAELVDSAGSSETGGILRATAQPGDVATSGTFALSPRACVISADRSRFAEAGSGEHGWLGARGPLPVGYLHDPAKTATTFIEVAGERIALTGDRAMLLDGGGLRLLGRDSVTINSGGEKIFAEEVERAVRRHPRVRDVIVVGRPHPRWGEQVVAVVVLDAPVAHSELVEAMSDQIARYKRPKIFIEVGAIPRSPAGKPDYRWAKSFVENLVEV